MQSGYAEAGNYGAAQPSPFAGGYEDAGRGPFKSAFSQGQRKSINIAALGVCLLVPWLIFCVAYSLNGMSIHYKSAGLTAVANIGCGLIVAMLGYSTLKNWRRMDGQPSWYIFIFVTSGIALVCGITFGNVNFQTNTVPLMDTLNMNTYVSVDPSVTKGQQLMDAGKIGFSYGASIDVTKSMGFKNLDTYCVAPITMTNSSGPAQLANYDFWAVGLNCCSGHQADFHCGEYNMPKARSGLRLLRDDLRAYFRLAVQQAEAAHAIRANHPIFVYWMEDPQTELDAFAAKAQTNELIGIAVAFGVQLLLVVAATICFAKLG